MRRICRGIEAVITGLTRNQFVDNTTRGFESLPLRQIQKDTTCGCPFVFGTVGQDRTRHPKVRGFAYAAQSASSWLVSGKRAYLRKANTPPKGHPSWVSFCIWHSWSGSNPAPKVRGFAYAAQSASSWLVSGKRAYLRKANTHPKGHPSRVPFAIDFQLLDMI